MFFFSYCDFSYWNEWYKLVILLLGTLRYWNADALKNALVEEGLDRVYGVR